MKRNALNLSTIVAMSTFGVTALVMAACGGKTIGSAPLLQKVAGTEIDQPVVACGGGYAHPNLCCEAAPGTASSCGVYVGSPFQACGSGYSTYPDPRSCCPLDASGDCIAPPSDPPPVSPPSCSYACPAGQYEPPGSPGTCCFDDGSTTVCSAQSGIEPAVPVCNCPVCPSGEGCDCACPEPAPTPAPVCDACPPGWQVPSGEPLLCCNDSSGVIQCFSQGVPPTPVPVTVDAGVPTPAPGGPGSFCGGNTANPPTCAAGLTCTPRPGCTAPAGDVGGTCQ